MYNSICLSMAHVSAPYYICIHSTTPFNSLNLMSGINITNPHIHKKTYHKSTTRYCLKMPFMSSNTTNFWQNSAKWKLNNLVKQAIKVNVQMLTHTWLPQGRLKSERQSFDEMREGPSSRQNPAFQAYSIFQNQPNWHFTPHKPNIYRLPNPQQQTFRLPHLKLSSQEIPFCSKTPSSIR